jgi:SAM-dependent methyltransferase
MSKPKKIEACIFCNSTSLKLLETVNVNVLDKLYFENFGFHIRDEFNGLNSIEFAECDSCNLNFFDPISAGSAEFYEKLQNHRKVYYNPDRQEFDYAKSFIKSNYSVLEIGSGSGFFASKIDVEKYIGLEFNDLAVEKAKANNIKLIKKSIEDYSTETNEPFDVVCSFHVLEHVTNVKAFIESSLKVLKSGGKLIIAVPCNDSVLVKNVNHVLNLPPHHTSRWTLKSLNNIAEIYNLEVIEHKVHNVSAKINKKQYYKSILVQKAIALLYPNNKLLIQNEKLNKITRPISSLNNRLKLFRFFKEENVIGENMTFVFQKK